MLFAAIEYLKRAELVISVQEWFGVEYRNKIDDTEDENCAKNRSNRPKNIPSGDDIEKEKNVSNINSNVRITNKFWYYLFIIGTEFGDELFYATMIPFWFWNIDGAVGRRVVFVWSIVMYIGQGLKDIIRWPRPGPPVQRLQSKWSVEYGMPSTHAMVKLTDKK